MTNAALKDTPAAGSAAGFPAQALRAVELESTPLRFLKTAQRLADRPAYYVRGDQGWEPHTWREFGADVQAAARSLVALGVQRGDVVCVLGFNRPEWSVMDFAAMMVGAVPAGIYWTSSADEVKYILNHSKAPVVLVENHERYERVVANAEALPHLRHVVMMKGAPAVHEWQLTWEQFLARGTPEQQAQVDARLQGIRPEHPGTLIYTSGTTGPAKAVELSHGNLSWTSSALGNLFSLDETDRVVSYLPLAHIAEQINAIHNQALMGHQIYFARSLDELADHLKEVRPTLFFGVPRVWEKMQTAIQARLATATGLKARMARWAMRVAEQWHRLDLDGKKPPLGLSLQKALAGRLAAQRRPGPPGCRRLPLHHRSQEGLAHHLGRQEHLTGQSGGRPDERAPDRARRGVWRRAAFSERPGDAQA